MSTRRPLLRIARAFSFTQPYLGIVLIGTGLGSATHPGWGALAAGLALLIDCWLPGPR